MATLRVALIYNKMGSEYYNEVYAEVTPEGEEGWATLMTLLKRRVNYVGMFSTPYPANKVGQKEAKEELQKLLRQLCKEKRIKWSEVRGKPGLIDL
jgi:hypothetical protein